VFDSVSGGRAPDELKYLNLCCRISASELTLVPPVVCPWRFLSCTNTRLTKGAITSRGPGAAGAWRGPRRPTGGRSLSSGTEMRDGPACRSLGSCPCEFAFGRKCETPSTPDKTSLQNPHFVQSIAPGPYFSTYFFYLSTQSLHHAFGSDSGISQALFASIHFTCLPRMVCVSLKRTSGVASRSPSRMACSSVLYEFGGYPAFLRSSTSLFSPLPAFDHPVFGHVLEPRRHGPVSRDLARVASDVVVRATRTQLLSQWFFGYHSHV
jgi:hypothetical protein